MKKRRNGEGTYGEKVISGIKYKFYRSPEGKYIYAKTAKELDEKVKQKQEEIKNYKAVINLKNNNLAVFSDLADEWLPTRKRKISQGVYDDYESIINTRIKKYPIGNEQIKGLTPKMFTLYFDKIGKKYSKGSVDKTWMVIKQIIKYGIDEGYIPSSFNMDKIERPDENRVAVKKKEVPFIDAVDMEHLYDELQNPLYGDGAKVLIFIMYSGLRVNEAVGLDWDNVAKDFSCIRVSQSLKNIIERDDNGNPIKNSDGTNKHTQILKTPKTESGVRTVPLPERARDILKYFYSIKKNKIVFITTNGTRFLNDNLRRCLKDALDRSDCVCKNYTVHSLRHGYGSILISQGVDIKVVSKLLGHSKISTTYDIYIGVLRKDEINAVNIFDNLQK